MSLRTGEKVFCSVPGRSEERVTEAHRLPRTASLAQRLTVGRLQSLVAYSHRERRTRHESLLQRPLRERSPSHRCSIDWPFSKNRCHTRRARPKAARPRPKSVPRFQNLHIQTANTEASRIGEHHRMGWPRIWHSKDRPHSIFGSAKIPWRFGLEHRTRECLPTHTSRDNSPVHLREA